MKLHAVVVAAALLAATPARAGVRITVDPTAPFTVSDLEQALGLRLTEPPHEDVDVRVGRLGFDQLIVVVGDRTEMVALPDRDRLASARVVAVVVMSLVDGGGAPGAAAPAIAAGGAPPGTPVQAIAATAAMVPGRSLWAVIAGIGYEHQAMKTLYEEGFDVRMLRFGIARTFAPNVRGIASVSTGLLKPEYDSHARIVPIRVGVEASTGPMAIEVGGQATVFERSQCRSDSVGQSYGVYGAAKVFVPVTPRARMVLEVTGHYVAKEPSDIDYYCFSVGEYLHYGGSASASLEWAL